MTELAMSAAGENAPALIVHPHALVGDGRTFCIVAFRPGETLGKYIERNGVDIPKQALVVWHNGRRVVDELWERLIPRTGDQVIIRARALGGGGGNKVLRTVAMIALTLSAPYLAGYALTGSWTVATGFSGALMTGAIQLGGSLFITPLLPEIAQ